EIRPTAQSRPFSREEGGKTSPAALALLGSEFMSAKEHLVKGVLVLHPQGLGFLRIPARNYAAQPADPYVPGPLIQRHHLREGWLVSGTTENGNKKGAGP